MQATAELIAMRDGDVTGQAGLVRAAHLRDHRAHRRAEVAVLEIDIRPGQLAAAQRDVDRLDVIRSRMVDAADDAEAMQAAGPGAAGARRSGSPGMVVAMVPNSPRTSAGASGLGSKLSKCDRPPCRNRMMAAFAFGAGPSALLARPGNKQRPERAGRLAKPLPARCHCRFRRFDHRRYSTCAGTLDRSHANHFHQISSAIFSCRSSKNCGRPL